MAFSRIDETDLLLPLHEAAREAPRWRTFLARLRQRTRADSAHLLTSPFGAALPAPFNDITPERLRPNRVYAAAELGERAAGDGRIIRVTEPSGAGAVLAIIGVARVFTAADSALLSALGPHLAVALTGMVAIDGLRARLDLAEDIVARTGTGRISFDRDARVLHFDPIAERIVRASTGNSPAIGQRLRIGDLEAERLLPLAAATFADSPDSAPRTLRLSAMPACNILLVPARPAMAALFRSPIATGPQRLAAIEAIHGLTHSEGRLAAALADGASIAQAAATIGLTIETARNYSKRIYAKTGVRGQAELVRLLCTGVSALA
ncbi:helix-turn-helix transcriptional regulator [Sphingomonas sp. TX0543]|uniref:helix-turn-helix transcriptional regulator n=1 Tax=unclassified Sphingomonas TaxID=196159 RepID=UPI0010F849F6|nr:hypothetical protein [Sphingomonas sp. 3P27F8]